MEKSFQPMADVADEDARLVPSEVHRTGARSHASLVFNLSVVDAELIASRADIQELQGKNEEVLTF